MDKHITMTDVVDVFRFKEPELLDFPDFKDIFNENFDIKDFIANKPSVTFEGNYKHQIAGQFLNQGQYHRLITASLNEITEETNNIKNMISNIASKDILIRSVTLTSCTHAARSLNLELNYCILDVNMIETEYETYKRIYDYVKNSLKEEDGLEISKKDFTPFINMSDSDFQKIIDSKFLEPNLINHILKQRSL